MSNSKLKGYQVERIHKKMTTDWLLHKHYAKRMCNIVHAFGLYNPSNELCGVITFGMPPSSKLAGSICGDIYGKYVLELNRLVVNDGLPKNALSYFVSNSIKLIPNDVIIVSFADANMNHHGYIYQATNFIYTGHTSNNSKLVDKYGNEFHFRNIGHTQTRLKSDIDIAKRIQDNLSDDLLKSEYIGLPNKNKYTGHCYVASESYYHLSNEYLEVYHLKHENSTHWFLRNKKGDIIDLTSKQFKTKVPYHLARRGFFLTKTPSKRSKILMDRVVSKPFKIIKRRINEQSLNEKDVANYLRSYKGDWKIKELDAEFGYTHTAGHWFRTDDSGFSYPTVDDWIKLKSLLNFDDTYDNIMLNFEWVACPTDIVDKLELRKIDILPKYRYVYFKGNRLFKKNAYNNLRLEILPYPKGDNVRYDCTYKVSGVKKMYSKWFE